ncbi:2-oxoadipate dioxygenase/decarboxylase family protein [Chitinophaga sedimenti]|uniref:2-oxoadipate dioxygenase/decarboxylase family protein n=1 Tax=Chitinophaga sedimenti TaxID=2033606 RepID=UPI0035560A2F
MSTLDIVLEGLMSRYKTRVPDVAGVIDAMVKDHVISNGEEIENDHIAFRTMGVPQLGIQSLEKIFLHYGYTKRDYYLFSEKKLDAYWYAPGRKVSTHLCE